MREMTFPSLSPQGYRYWGGVGVPQSCESALTHYRLVANQGERLLHLFFIILVFLLKQTITRWLFFSELQWRVTCL